MKHFFGNLSTINKKVVVVKKPSDAEEYPFFGGGRMDDFGNIVPQEAVVISDQPNRLLVGYLKQNKMTYKESFEKTDYVCGMVDFQILEPLEMGA